MTTMLGVKPNDDTKVMSDAKMSVLMMTTFVAVKLNDDAKVMNDAKMPVLTKC